MKKQSKKSWNIPVELGKTYEIPIQSMGNNGEGVGRYENFTVFVSYALPGEWVEAKITLCKKNYAVGEIVTILETSQNRIEPSCSIYGKCGGCTLQHINYEAQLNLKTQKVKDIIERIAKMDPNLVLPTIGPKNPWNYRNKMQLPVAGTVDDVQMGFYARGSHEVVPCNDCKIQLEENNQIIRSCQRIIKELHIAPYNELTGEGVVRHIVGRVAKPRSISEVQKYDNKKIGEEVKQTEGVTHAGDLMIIIVTATADLPHKEEWISRLRKDFPQITSIVQNYNPKKTNVILGRQNTLLWGQEYITDQIHNLEFRLSPHSFLQVNPEQTEVLYGKALEYAQLTGEETVIDAYCGTGTISLFMAPKAKKVYGIEIVEPAIIDARANAKRNGFTNTEFLVADAAKAMPELYKKGVRADVIMFDPVRAGCDQAVLDAAVDMNPERMVYVSCNPATMARDIAILAERGYKTVEVQPVDMFPMTAHVESVALIQRKKA